jgi:hypothetical protein
MTSDFILGKPFKGITVLLETRVLVPDPDDPEPKQTRLFCREESQNSQNVKCKYHMLVMRLLCLFAAKVFPFRQEFYFSH